MLAIEQLDEVVIQANRATGGAQAPSLASPIAVSVATMRSRSSINAAESVTSMPNVGRRVFPLGDLLSDQRLGRGQLIPRDDGALGQAEFPSLRRRTRRMQQPAAVRLDALKLRVA